MANWRETIFYCVLVVTAGASIAFVLTQFVGCERERQKQQADVRRLYYESTGVIPPDELGPL